MTYVSFSEDPYLHNEQMDWIKENVKWFWQRGWVNKHIGLADFTIGARIPDDVAIVFKLRFGLK
jgi:hypothetical protein